MTTPQQQGMKRIQDFLGELRVLCVVNNVSALVFRDKNASIEIAGDQVTVNGLDFDRVQKQDMTRLAQVIGMNPSDVKNANGLTQQGIEDFMQLVVQSMKKYGITRMYNQKSGGKLSWRKEAGQDTFGSTDIAFVLNQ